ncbi:OmpA family protein [Flavivirga aquatica]|uniref:OmpA family protein n=1 Tax=Flavivirga aquatica TaxID=1849968 RepID=UPI0009F6EC19|nr:OmpA family protein [Flavivirga aquatica]
MSKKTSYLLGILFSIILGTILHYFLCCNKESTEYKENEDKEKVVSEIKKATRNAFIIADASIDENDSFNFKVSNFSILGPVSESVTNSVLKLKDFLLEQPLKIVDISGFYKGDELNNSAYPNLGIARANAVKNYLVSQGISSKQIDTKGQLNDEINSDENNTLFGPVDFSILTIGASNTTAMNTLKEACSKLKTDPLVISF